MHFWLCRRLLGHIKLEQISDWVFPNSHNWYHWAVIGWLPLLNIQKAMSVFFKQLSNLLYLLKDVDHFIIFQVFIFYLNLIQLFCDFPGQI